MITPIINTKGIKEILECFEREKDSLRKENKAQVQKIAEQKQEKKELEKKNQLLKAKLVKYRTKTASKSQNTPLITSKTQYCLYLHRWL